MDFIDLRHRAGLPDKYCAEYFQVHRTTVLRWDSGDIEPPRAVIECLRMLSGEMPSFAGRSAFKDWRFCAEYLYSPSGARFTPGDLNAIHWDQEIMTQQEVTIRRLTEQVSTLSEQVEILHNRLGPKMPANVVRFPGVKAQ